MAAVDNRKIKLFLSRDLHSELTRKIIGKSHGDRLFTGDAHRSSVYLPDLYQAIDAGMEEILRLELMQMSIPCLLGASTVDRKHTSKVQEIATLQAELLREEREKPSRMSDANDTTAASTTTSHFHSLLHSQHSSKEDNGLSLELNHNSSFSSSTPTENWSPFTHYGSNDSCDRDFFPGITTTRDLTTTSSSVSRNNSSARNPLVARRNSNIERMLNEVSQRSSRNQSPKVPTEISLAPSRFSFFVPTTTPEKNICLTPPGSSGIAAPPIATDADSNVIVPPTVPPVASRSASDTNNRRTIQADKLEKRFAASFPTRPVQSKSPVTVSSIQVMSRQDRINYHQNISRKLSQNIIKKASGNI